MEHLENDMDDLFQKAGELYPLKTSESDWKGVLGKLNEEGFGDQKGVIKMNSKELGNKRRWLLLLLLIPIGIGTVFYFAAPGHKNHSSESKLITINKSRNSATSKTSEKSITPITLQNTNQKNGIATNAEPATVAGKQNNISSILLNRGQPQHYPMNRPQENNNSRSAKHLSVLSSEIINDNLALSQNAGNNQVATDRSLAEKPLNLSAVRGNPTILVSAAQLSLSDSKSVSGLPSAENSKKQNKNTVNKGFYVGLLGGPDLSAVKFQSVKQLGFSLGAIVGYRINKRFAIETGLLWDKKYYYSEGEYFNKSEITLPPNTTILTVNGNCNMWEIPISLRYDFALGVNHSFFIKGGFSSYIMNHENYVASVNKSGYNPWNYPFQSDQTKNYFLSIVQLSAGYEYSVSAKTKLSFEPYVKIPLQGFGIGSMPISSTGFYIGISYSLH
jgi:hypothetical protein